MFIYCCLDDVLESFDICQAKHSQLAQVLQSFVQGGKQICDIDM